VPLSLDKDRPTGFQAPQCVVKATSDGHEFSRHGAIEVRTPKFCRALKRPILVEDDAFIDQGSPRQKVGETSIGTAVFGEIHHDEAHVLR
jgi:hypothetical protein